MALKSTSQSPLHQRNQTSGFDSENQVIENRKREGWHLLFQRAKTVIGEVDLLFQKGNQIQLIEVKTLDDSWRSFQRISHRQIQKLVLNQLHFSKLDPRYDVSCWVAWVGRQQIEYVAIN